MKFSTGPKKRSRLQGHRKRRRIIEIKHRAAEREPGWTEYKTIKQYQSMGGMLDEFRTYGYRAGIENYFGDAPNAQDNGHHWLTEDNGGQ